MDIGIKINQILFDYNCNVQHIAATIHQIFPSSSLSSSHLWSTLWYGIQYTTLKIWIDNKIIQPWWNGIQQLQQQSVEEDFVREFAALIQQIYQQHQFICSRLRELDRVLSSSSLSTPPHSSCLSQYIQLMHTTMLASFTIAHQSNQRITTFPLCPAVLPTLYSPRAVLLHSVLHRWLQHALYTFIRHHNVQAGAGYIADTGVTPILSYATFSAVCAQLHALGFSDPSPSAAIPSYFLMNFLFAQIQQYIISQCVGIWSESKLNGLMTFVVDIMVPFLSVLFSLSSHPHTISMCKRKLTIFTYDLFVTYRCKEIFDMLKDYPDSLCGWQDFHTAMVHSRGESRIIDSCTKQLQSRLLIPDSSGILMDHVLLSSRIREYLRARPDTVQEIVYGLWWAWEKKAEEERREERRLEEEENGNLDASVASSISSDHYGLHPDLLDHLQQNIPDSTAYGDESDMEEEGWMAEAETDAAVLYQHSHDNWLPDPLDAHPTHMSRRSRIADILDMLIELCSNNTERNQDIMLTQYKQFMCHRLLHKQGQQLFDTDIEVSHLELMKLRFGDHHPSLIEVDIMIRDIQQSKRIWSQINDLHTHDHLHHTTSKFAQVVQSMNTNNQHTLPLSLPSIIQQFHGVIISQEFWPTLPVPDTPLDQFQLPQCFQYILTAYSQLYHSIKSPRVLDWRLRDNLGMMTIEIVMQDGREKQLSVTPIQYGIIEKFDVTSEFNGTHKNIWSAGELAEELHIDEAQLHNYIQYWVEQSIIKQSRNSAHQVTYELNEWLGAADSDNVNVDVYSDNNLQTGSNSNQEQDAALETYILGIFNNFVTLSVEKLHNQMKFFRTPELLYTKSESELKAFLTQLEQRGLLVRKDGGYTRAKQLKA